MDSRLLRGNDGFKGAGGGPDEVFARADRLLGRNGIAEVLALLGYYSSVAMGVKLHRVLVSA
ncbi:MAG: hypothetical protein ACXWIJ_08365 [Burkholderiales bacterium]